MPKGNEIPDHPGWRYERRQNNSDRFIVYDPTGTPILSDDPLYSRHPRYFRNLQAILEYLTARES